MPLLRPVDLYAQVTDIISSTANCPVNWAQHPDPLTLFEIISIKERLAEYLAGVIDAYFREKNH